MNKYLSLLLLEDSEFDADLLVYTIEIGGYTVNWRRVETQITFEQALHERRWDLVFVDYTIPGYSGISALEFIRENFSDTPALMISGTMGEDNAVEAMRAGANDYFVKGNYSRLVPAIARELREAKSRQDKKNIDAALRESEAQYRTLIEKTPVATAVYRNEGILYINPACQKLLGAEELKDVINLSPLDFVHPDDKDIVHERAMLAWKKFLPPLEQRVVRLDGEIIEVEVVSGPIIYQGQKAVIVTLLDITERKRSREIIQRRAVQLRVAAEIARDATAARDVEELLNHSALLIQERFDFYHAGIFLLDAQKKYAHLAAAPGEAGRKMLEQGHKLAVGKVGIVGHVAGTGKPRIALDVGEDAIHFKQPLLPETRSEMGLPLIVEGHVIGVLDVQSQQEAAFDDEDVQMLQIMADQLAVAIDKANLFSEVQRRAHELSVLYDTALATSSELDENILLQRLYEQVDQFLKPDTFLVAIYDELDGEFHIRFAVEDGTVMESLLHQHFPIRTGGLTGWVIRNRKPLHLNDITRDKLPDTPIPFYQNQQNTHSWLGIPLIVKDRVLGALSIQSFSPNAFSEEQRKFLETLTNQAAIAIDNANLFETIDKRAEELDIERRRLSLLYEIGKVLSLSLDPDDIMEQAVIRTCQAMDGRESLALFYDKKSETLVPFAIYDHKINKLIDEKHTMPLGKGLAGWVARERKPAIVHDVRKDARWQNISSRDTKIRSAISAPIFDGNKIIGTLSVHHYEVNAFTEDHLNLLDAIGQQIALAYSNASRYQEINRLVDRLGAQQYRLESIIKELPIGVVLFNEENRVLSTNTLGQEYLLLLAPDQTEGEIKQVGPYPIETLLSHQDALLPYEIATSETPSKRFEAQARSVLGGNTEERLLIIRDVTREREIQERIHMQERLATVGQLAAGIAHDFNNIMAAIVIYADLLRTDKSLTANSREHLGIIQQQVQRASSLIRQILDFSRRSVMEQTEIELLPFLKEIEKLLNRMLPETIQTTLVYE
jgi:PAS domain S-box-containing protein